MRKVSTTIAAFACMCLLALQVSGLHLHVGLGSDDVGLHGAHSHQVPAHDYGHDHTGDVDVQLLEQFVGQWSKIVALVSYIFVLILATWLIQPTWSPPLRSGKIGRRLRWRPLLRAPPLHV